MLALIYLQGEEGVAFFRGSTEYIEASSFVISDLRKAFMSIVLQCFDITSCQVTKVLALSFSVCSVFPALRLYKLCYLLLAAIAVPLGGPVAGGRRAWSGCCGSRPPAQTTSLGTLLPASGQASQIC